jgi:hypothetical protein
MYKQNRYLRGKEYCQLCFLCNQLVAMEVSEPCNEVSYFRSLQDVDLGSPRVKIQVSYRISRE